MFVVADAEALRTVQHAMESRKELEAQDRLLENNLSKYVYPRRGFNPGFLGLYE